jgi:hypothetical protein
MSGTTSWSAGAGRLGPDASRPPGRRRKRIRRWSTWRLREHRARPSPSNRLVSRLLKHFAGYGHIKHTDNPSSVMLDSSAFVTVLQRNNKVDSSVSRFREQIAIEPGLARPHIRTLPYHQSDRLGNNATDKKNGQVQVPQARRFGRSRRFCGMDGNRGIFVGRQRARPSSPSRAEPAQSRAPRRAAPHGRGGQAAARRHARAIRMSGQTEADKRAVLATRAAGDYSPSCRSKQGDHVKTGDLVAGARCRGQDRRSVETARQVVKQREAELGGRAAPDQDRAASPSSSSTTPWSALTAAPRSCRRRRPNSTATACWRRSTASSTRWRSNSAVLRDAGRRGRDAAQSRPDPRARASQRARPALRQDRRRGRGEAGQRRDGEGQGALHQPRRLRLQTRTFRVEVAIPNADGASRPA